MSLVSGLIVAPSGLHGRPESVSNQGQHHVTTGGGPPPKDQVELDPPTISAQRIHSFRMRLAVERP